MEARLPSDRRNHRPRSWDGPHLHLPHSINMTSNSKVLASVEDELTDCSYGRRSSSSSFLSYPTMDDISSSETDIDVEEVFERANLVRRQRDDDDNNHDASHLLCQQVMDEQGCLDELYAQRINNKAPSSCESFTTTSKRPNFVDDYSYYGAHQSSTETTCEESTIFSETVSPETCDGDYAVAMSSSTSIAVATGHSSASAFDVYSPKQSAKAPSRNSHKTTDSGSSWQRESLSCADLMQHPPVRDPYVARSQGRTITSRYNDANMYSDRHERQRNTQPYYPSRKQLQQQDVEREYHHDIFMLEKEPAVSQTMSHYSEDPRRHHPSARRYPNMNANDDIDVDDQPTCAVVPEIEIAPGQSMPLRSSQETIASVECGHMATLACLACETFLATVPDCQLVICPVCRYLSPVDDGDCFQNGHAVVVSRQRRGIGLGLQL